MKSKDKPPLSVVPFKKPEQKPPGVIFDGAIGLLKELIAEIEAGKAKPDKLCVFFMECGTTPESWRPRYWYTGVDTTERIAYGELMKLQAIEDWRTP